MPEDLDSPLVFLPANLAEHTSDPSYVVVIQAKEDFLRWITMPRPGAEWLQVRDLLGDEDVWAAAAQSSTTLPVDVIMANPQEEFATLYRLVDVHLTREVRVAIPVRRGLMKALRLAASLHLPVRLLPGQPDAQAMEELQEAADFYLHDSNVETPVEFFHSLLAAFRGAETGTLWTILETDPQKFATYHVSGEVALPTNFVADRLEKLVNEQAECAQCPWVQQCAGYFKYPEASYSCSGIKKLFSTLQDAAEEMTRDLEARIPEMI